MSAPTHFNAGMSNTAFRLRLKREFEKVYPTMTQTNSTKTVAMDTEYHWRPITKDTPLGVKVQLISRGRSGVASYGVLGSTNTWFTHWAPLPTFKKD